MSKKIKKVTLESLATTVGSVSTTVDSLSATVGSLSTKVESLVTTVEAGFKRMDKGFKEAKEDNESLARMVSHGFEDVTAKMATKDSVIKLDQSQARLEQGQENMLLRLDYLAPQFEVKELTRRVKRLEDRAGIRHTGTR